MTLQEVRDGDVPDDLSRLPSLEEDRVRDAMNSLNGIKQEVAARRALFNERGRRGRVYRAPWANWAWHSDTYLKCVAFGNFVVGGIVDGKTRYVLALVLLNTKKAIEMFRQVYLPAVREFGLADQFVSDQGTEFKPVERSQTRWNIE